MAVTVRSVESLPVAGRVRRKSPLQIITCRIRQALYAACGGAFAGSVGGLFSGAITPERFVVGILAAYSIGLFGILVEVVENHSFGDERESDE